MNTISLASACRRVRAALRGLGRIASALSTACLVLILLGGLALVLRSYQPDGWRMESAAAPATLATLTPAGGAPFLLYGLGSLERGQSGGIVAMELPAGRLVGHTGLSMQGWSLSLSPDGRRAYLLDGPRFSELETPSLRVLRQTSLSNPINLLGVGRVVAVAPDGAEVYVETWHQTGPLRVDPQLGVGQPDGEYGITVYNVAQGAFVREIQLEPPWCGVAELYVLPNRDLAVLCSTAQQLRLVVTAAGRQVASVGVNAVAGVPTVDGRHFLTVGVGGNVHDIDLSVKAQSRQLQLRSASGTVWVPRQRLHLSADGARLFVRTAPGDAEARATGQGTAVAVIDTTTLQQVAEVPLPAAAYDAAPAPDGSALLTSNTNTQDALAAATRLVDVPSGRELARWPGLLVGLEAWSASRLATIASPATTLGRAQSVRRWPATPAVPVARREGE